MRKSHPKPAQLDLFNLSEDGNRVAPPQWQNLPISTRHKTAKKITGLMARLLMEHNRSRQAVDIDDPLANGESSDV